MRRLARWLLNAVTVLSVLLCVATLVLWVRSYWVADGILWLRSAGGRQCNVVLWTGRGGLMVGAAHFAAAQGDGAKAGLSFGTLKPTSYYPDWGQPPYQVVARHYAGFGYGHAWIPRIIDVQSLTAPLWVVAIFWSGLPASRWLRTVRRKTRSRTGRCRRCSYDLTGNVSGLCPECGTSIVKPATISSA